jgi:histidinol-phosphatase (PHP family)
MLDDSQSVLYETHSHTPLCKHAVGLPSEYAAVASRRGLKGLIVTCHNPMPNGFSSGVRMAPEEFGHYLALVEQARHEWADRVDVRLGLEADYFPGHEKWLRLQLSSHGFDYVLGSVHPQIGEYKERFWDQDPLQVQETYFSLLADAAEAGLFDCLAHPDLIKNEVPHDWEPARILPGICRALDRIAETGIAMELNTSGVNKRIAEMNPFPEMLQEIHQRGIPVVLGADAHEPGRVADGFEFGLDLLASIGFRFVSVFLERQRHEIPIEQARSSLLSTTCAGRIGS